MVRNHIFMEIMPPMLRRCNLFDDLINIYAVADIHGERGRLDMIREVIARGEPHCLVLAGDILGHPRDHATIDVLGKFNLPTFVVPGNMDGPSLQIQVQASRNLFWVVSSPAVFEGLTFWGVDPDLRHGEALEHNEDLVMISHLPPWGVQDRDFFGRRAGSRAILALIDRIRPRAVICGHIHEDCGWTYYDEIPVINCSMGGGGGGALIEVHDRRVSQITMIR